MFFEKQQCSPQKQKVGLLSRGVITLGNVPSHYTGNSCQVFRRGISIQSNSMNYPVQLSHLPSHHLSLKTPALASTKDIGWKFILLSYLPLSYVPPWQFSPIGILFTTDESYKVNECKTLSEDYLSISFCPNTKAKFSIIANLFSLVGNSFALPFI
jgi:hypothetical protein